MALLLVCFSQQVLLASVDVNSQLDGRPLSDINIALVQTQTFKSAITRELELFLLERNACV